MLRQRPPVDQNRPRSFPEDPKGLGHRNEGQTMIENDLNQSRDSGLGSLNASLNSSRDETPIESPIPRPLSPANLMGALHLWFLVCVQYVVLCFKRLLALVSLQAELNKRTATDLKSEKDSYNRVTSIVPKYRSQSTSPVFSSEELKAQLCWSMPAANSLSDSGVLGDVETSELLMGSVAETRIITTVFEVLGAGLGPLIEDVESELRMWFEEQGLLVVCTELIWSVPSGRRDPSAEIKMKSNLLRSLRGNNRRVLDLKFASPSQYPLCLPDSTTEEVSGREGTHGSYHGIYRRYYAGLTPLRHRETTEVHAGYWMFDKTTLRPNPEHFLLGTNRKAQELSKTCLVALNVIVLKL